MKPLIYVYKQVQMPGERLVDIKAQADRLSDTDKAILIGWAETEMSVLGVEAA